MRVKKRPVLGRRIFKGGSHAGWKYHGRMGKTE